jgi:pectate lyase
MVRAISITVLTAMSLALAACGATAGANTPPPPAPAQDVAGPGVQSAVLFSEDFGTSTLDGWTAEDFSEGPESPATWEVQNGEVFQRGNASGLPAPDSTYLFTGDSSWSDYRVSAYAYAVAPTRLGLIARKSGANYYQSWLDVQEGASELVLAVVKNGETTVLARVPAPANTEGAWLKLALEVRGSTITASLDDATTVSASDASLSSGAAGLYATADATARFDNVLVSE